MKYEGWPADGELVVGKVDEIEDFGVFVDLEEYEGKRGLVHVSEVASGWIKNVRDHVNADQTVVAKVLGVDEESQQIDLSLKDVNDHQRSEAIQEWKNNQKADKWLSLAFGGDLAVERYREIVGALIEEYATLYDAFEAAAIHGGEALEGISLPDEDKSAIVETARENVSVPYVDVTGYVDLESPNADGVDDVRAALQAAEGDGAVAEEVDLEVTYVGSPEYRIRVRAPDYKTAETALEDSVERARTTMEDRGGEISFHRNREVQE
jgi:translation initiation factor 2 subunit 1